MKIAIFAYSDNGCLLAQKVAQVYREKGDVASCYAIAKFAQKYDFSAVSSTREAVQTRFPTTDVMIFVGACGIAVRAIAPCVKSKTEDPACLVIDDGANFIIPILSGHIGGANEHCAFLAQALCATPVITTATDVHQKFSVDTFARKQGFAISSMKTAMAFSAAILTQDLPICACEAVHLPATLPSALYPAAEGSLGVYIGYRSATPYETTLQLTPKILTLGIGCKKGTPLEAIEHLVLRVLEKERIAMDAVLQVASIDLKAQEAGLHAFCEKYQLPVAFYSAETLQAVSGTFTPSPFVQSITGVDNVCERAAVCGAGGGQCIVRKTSCNGVTLSIACAEREVSFD